MPDDVSYLVAYAKIVEDSNGILLQGVYFGGIAAEYDTAAAIAKDCVNSTKGGTILPKVLKLVGKHQALEALYDAVDCFESVTASMVEADQTIRRSQTRQK